MCQKDPWVDHMWSYTHPHYLDIWEGNSYSFTQSSHLEFPVIFITWHIFDQCCQLSSLTVHVTTLTEANVILRASKNSILRLKLHSLPFLQIIYLINALIVTLFITVHWSSLFIAVRWISLFIYSVTSARELMSSTSQSMCQIITALPYWSKLAWNLNQSYK